MGYKFKAGAIAAKDKDGKSVKMNLVLDRTTEESLAEISALTEAKQTEIQNKGEQTLASIPEDYSDLAESVGEISDILEVSKKIQYLLQSNETVGKYYRVDAGVLKRIDNGGYAIYEPITLSKGTYYFSNVFTNFTRLKHNGSFVDLSTYLSKSGAYSGLVIFDDTYEVYFTKNANTVSMLVNDTEPPINYVEGVYYQGSQIIDKIRRTDIIVAKDGSGDYSSLLEAVIDATKSMYSTVRVRKGIYNLIDEFKAYYGTDFFDSYNTSKSRGVFLTNGVHLIFDSDTKVTFNYTGTNADVMKYFAPFNADSTKGVGFTVENMTLECSNCRYAVHDEMNSRPYPYKHEYINCNMIIDNTHNTAWNSKQCIGGGLGENGHIIIKDCIFDSIGSDDYGIVTYHNGSSVECKSNLFVSGNYFKRNGTFSLIYYGESTKMTTALVSNNSLGSTIKVLGEGGSTNVNAEVIDFNNVVRQN